MQRFIKFCLVHVGRFGPLGTMIVVEIVCDLFSDGLTLVELPQGALQ